MSKIVSSWKSYPAKEANRILRRSGQFWGKDYWDTYMRDEQHKLRTRRHIDKQSCQGAPRA